MTVSGGDFIPVTSGVESLPDAAVQVISQTIDNDTLNAIADKIEVCNTLLLGINESI